MPVDCSKGSLAYLHANAHGQWLASSCKKSGFRRGAELGSMQGRIPHYLFGSGSVDSMIVVDLWDAVADNDVESYQEWNWSAIKAEYEANRAPFADRWQTFVERTADAARRVADGSLDFVFIDADHSETGVLADLCAWVPKVRAGGMVSGHDYNWPSVRSGLAAFGATVEQAPGNCWFWIKPQTEGIKA